VLSGEVTCGSSTFKAGEFFLVPASLDAATIAAKDATAEVLRSTLPV